MTVNPYRRKFSLDGSSGGESASMEFKCAPLVIGTDIGRSIRCPAAFHEAYGFRPTALRNPYDEIFLAGEGQKPTRCVVGPLASSGWKTWSCSCQRSLTKSHGISKRAWWLLHGGVYNKQRSLHLASCGMMELYAPPSSYTWITYTRDKL